jgi:putative nucleotidyltransferase with HDIG domain
MFSRRRAGAFRVVAWLAALPGQPARAGTLFVMSVFCLLVTFFLAIVLYTTWESNELNLRAGQIADRTIKAPRTATFESKLLTDQARKEAYDDARNIVLVHDPLVATAQLEALNRLLGQVETIRAERGEDLQAATEKAQAALEGLTAEDAQLLVSVSDESWSRIEVEARRLLMTVMNGEVRGEDVAAVKESLLGLANPSLTPAERRLAVTLARSFVRANVQIDEERTKAAREAAAQQVEPVLVTVQGGQVIVRDGDVVTPEVIEKLEYFGLLAPQQSWQQFSGLLGVVALLVTGLTLSLHRFLHHTRQIRQLFLIGVMLVTTVAVGRLVLSLPELRYMFPVASAVMLLAILLDFRVAAITGAFTGLLLGAVTGLSYDIALFAFLSSLAGAAVIWRAERTVTFLWSGLAVTATVAAVALLFQLVSNRFALTEAVTVLIHAAVNGALSASLCFLSFSLLGRLLGITTHLQLLELAHPNQPLLARLAREAPGTYHHSLVVSNLAEAAAEVVGGDPLLTRVAVLYHDIGKVIRPSFFVENQANRANVHDTLDPRTSVQLIREHVIDGVRLARKARLPKPILDVIQQHHGTSLIRYFYSKALASGEPVDEAAFRYPGPKPQTKEAAVILLADSVEATVRSAAQSGKLYEDVVPNGPGRPGTKLEEIVDRVIRERLEDGQLDECDLTLRQIGEIRRVFLGILEGIYHPRIEYPELAHQPSQRPVLEAAGLVAMGESD